MSANGPTRTFRSPAGLCICVLTFSMGFRSASEDFAISSCGQLREETSKASCKVAWRQGVPLVRGRHCQALRAALPPTTGRRNAATPNVGPAILGRMGEKHWAHVEIFRLNQRL